MSFLEMECSYEDASVLRESVRNGFRNKLQ